MCPDLKIGYTNLMIIISIAIIAEFSLNQMFWNFYYWKWFVWKQNIKF